MTEQLGLDQRAWIAPQLTGDEGPAARGRVPVDRRAPPAPCRCRSRHWISTGASAHGNAPQPGRSSSTIAALWPRIGVGATRRIGPAAGNRAAARGHARDRGRLSRRGRSKGRVWWSNRCARIRSRQAGHAISAASKTAHPFEVLVAPGKASSSAQRASSACGLHDQADATAASARAAGARALGVCVRCRSQPAAHSAAPISSAAAASPIKRIRLRDIVDVPAHCIAA